MSNTSLPIGLKKEEIIEGNKIIAEFMGGKTGNGGTKKYPSFNRIPIWHGKKMRHWTISTKDLRYHSDYNWLMPVVQKIKSLPVLNSKYLYFLIIHATIELTYSHVVEFIRWYNSQPIKTT